MNVYTDSLPDLKHYKNDYYKVAAVTTLSFKSSSK